mgnify:FL=1
MLLIVYNTYHTIQNKAIDSRIYHVIIYTRMLLIVYITHIAQFKTKAIDSLTNILRRANSRKRIKSYKLITLFLLFKLQSGLGPLIRT